MPDPLIRARRGRRRLAAAGWILVVAGPLVALTGLVVLPFAFPFALAAGGLTLLAGRQLVALRGPVSALVAAAITLLAGVATLLGATMGGTSAPPLGVILGALLVLLSTTCLAIVFTDAAYLPTGPGERADE